MRAIVSLFLLSAALLTPEVSFAVLIHVPVQVPTIKAGIIEAQPGDTVMVAPGTYTGTGFRDLDFGGKAIVVMSFKGSGATIIDCQGSRPDPHRAFWVHQGEDSKTVIQGFTIKGGFGPYDGPNGHSVGGGIYCENGSSPEIIDCIFDGNQAANAGAGLCCVEGSSPVVDSCRFVNNRALRTGITGYGGAVRCEGVSPEFSRCRFVGNRANLGGAVSCNGSGATFTRCEFVDNSAEAYGPGQPMNPGNGGAMHLLNSSPVLTQCLFSRNRALSGLNSAMKGAIGGGIACYASLPFVAGCTFFGNVAEQYNDTIIGVGAAIYAEASPAQIQNSIIAFNEQAEAVYTGDLVDAKEATVPEFLCSDIYGNELGDWIDGFADQLGQNHNISLDPLFCDTAQRNFHLLAASPCAPDYTGCLDVMGAFSIGCETDAYDSDTRPVVNTILSQNHPNPFNQSTVISYTLESTSYVRLTVYNILGQPVRCLMDGVSAAGAHLIFWDGKDGFGREAASGIYIYSISFDQGRQARKMILTR